MLALIRHSTRRYRAWLFILTAALCLTAILEAGHTHGVFTPEDSHCAICLHAVTLGKALPSSAIFTLPLLFSILTCFYCNRFAPQLNRHFAPIRAPPLQLLNP